MNLRILLVSAGASLTAAVLLFAGGLGAIEIVTAHHCDGGYLCALPKTPERHDLNYAALLRAEQRVGLR
jgi:hypothetical protein